MSSGRRVVEEEEKVGRLVKTSRALEPWALGRSEAIGLWLEVPTARELVL